MSAPGAGTRTMRPREGTRTSEPGEGTATSRPGDAVDPAIGPAEARDGAFVALSLISHTNAGKTTLARTLLGRDVGEVRDAAHVTLEAASYPLVTTDDGAKLLLWDTPGFGDSARLARRLARHGNPIGWFLSEVWDRFRERPLWLAQKAVRNVRDEADAVLYLVNAAESPADAGYLPAELEVLQWIGKPVIALLNQTGRPRPAEEDAAEVARWQAALRPWPFVHGVLPLDAFARCWVQEAVLLRAVHAALAPVRAAAFEPLAQAFIARRIEQFDAAMHALAQPIAAAARAHAVLEERPDGWRGLRRLLGLERAAQSRALAHAMAPLAQRLDADIRASTDALIAIHGLEGHAAQDVTAWLREHVATGEALSEGKAALWGGVVSGALSGLVADLAAGGLTLGAGMIAGALAGALGGAGIARGYNTARGVRSDVVRWSDAFLDGLVRGALLRYLAVAHYGRGRGPWSESEPPAFWREAVAGAVERHHARLAAVWRARDAGSPEGLAEELAAVLRDIATAVLEALYPDALAAVRAVQG